MVPPLFAPDEPEPLCAVTGARGGAEGANALSRHALPDDLPRIPSRVAFQPGATLSAGGGRVLLPFKGLRIQRLPVGSPSELKTDDYSFSFFSLMSMT